MHKESRMMSQEGLNMDRRSYSFPSAPESFRQTVRQTVMENMQETAENNQFHVGRATAGYATAGKKKYLTGFSKAAVVAACMLILGGSVAFAVNFSGINRYLHRWWGKGIPEENIITGLDSEKDTLLEIDEVYIDGTYLAFTAHLPEGAVWIPEGAGDHAYVNGRNCYMAQFERDTEKPGSYFGLIDLTFEMSGEGDDYINKEVTGEEVTVKLSLFTEGTDERKDFTFRASIGDALENTAAVPEQMIEVEEGITAWVKNSTVAPSVIKLHIDFAAENEDAEARLDKYIYDFYYVEDANGIRYEDFYSMLQGGREWYAEITNFDMDSDYIKFIPYTVEYDAAADKWLYETAKTDEEHAFIVKLK
ncbi:MAG: hypothetical protein NC300_10605 [Bacteroidales bacterium]|nr:hypothetical protein [Clostridium sp.]MCM1204581.1 hypothetical protein [Bacteroidales bacterium]